MKPYLALLLGLLIPCLSGCSDDSLPATGEWVGYAILDDERLLPIKVYLDLRPDSLSGYFDVAGEHTEIPELSLDGTELSLLFSEYGAAMVGTVDAGRYSGEYRRFRVDTTTIPFVLFHEPVRDAPRPADPDAAGPYKVIIGTGDDADSSGIAELRVEGGALSGVIIHPTGDYGLLEGIQDDGTIRLFRFTGWQALYFEMTRSDLGYRGRYHLRGDPARDVALIRTSDGVREVERTTRLRNPEGSFLFSGLTADGSIITSQDARFSGKPVVVDIMGTWCHNCLDAAPLLQEAFEQHAADSLQVVSLSFEIMDDAAAGLKNLELFRERFGLTYPLLYAGSLDEENVTARLHSQLENFFSYPTTIFIDKEGRVTDIHTGFNGPTTGDRWMEQQAEFEEAVKKIID
jgi:thiol-disulfide isomerase/thioredoxin